MGAGGEPRPYQQGALTMQTKPVLLHSFAELKTKAFNAKPKQAPSKKVQINLGDGNPKSDGCAEWVRFKSECVLLKGEKK
jgi:hypothetical protein